MIRILATLLIKKLRGVRPLPADAEDTKPNNSPKTLAELAQYYSRRAGGFVEIINSSPPTKSHGHKSEW